MSLNEELEDVSDINFVVPNEIPSNVIPRLIRMLVIATRKHKLDYGSLRYIHRQAVKRSRITKPRPAKKLYDLPTTEEFDLFFDCIEDSQIKLIFMLLQNTGLRVSELCNLKVEKINFQNTTIFITGKGNKDRIVPITKKIIDRVQLFLSGRKHHYLFETSRSTPFTPRRIEQLCQRYKTKAGIIKKLTPHSFRHFYFTKLAELGIDVDIRAMIAGHSSTRTQETYTHIGLGGTKDLIIEALEKLENQKTFK